MSDQPNPSSVLHCGGIVSSQQLAAAVLAVDKPEHIIPLVDVDAKSLLNPTAEVDAELKMLGALVPEDIYWKFKHAATERKESMQTAMMHAAIMYTETPTQ